MMLSRRTIFFVAVLLVLTTLTFGWLGGSVSNGSWVRTTCGVVAGASWIGLLVPSIFHALNSNRYERWMLTCVTTAAAAVSFALFFRMDDTISLLSSVLGGTLIGSLVFWKYELIWSSRSRS